MHKQLAVFALALIVALAALPAGAQERLFATDYAFVEPRPEPDGRYAGPPRGEGEGSDIVELDPATGSELNRFAAPVSFFSGPEGLAFDGTSLWFYSAPLGRGPEGVQAGQLYRLNPDTGAVLQSWQMTVSLDYDALGVLNGLVYLLRFPAGELHVFDPQTGTVIQQLDLFAANPAFPGQFVGGLSGFPSEGVLLVTSETFVGDPEAGEGGIGDLLYEIHQLNPATGAIVDTFPAGLDFNAGLAAVDGRIYAGRLDSPVVLVFATDGTIVDTLTLSHPVSALGGDGGTAPGPGPSVLEIPTASGVGLAALAALLAGAGALSLRRRARI